MEDQIGTVLHWSIRRSPKKQKAKMVIRRNPDRIRISAATPLPSNPSRHSQVNLKFKNKKKLKKTEQTQIKKLNNSGFQTVHLIRLKFKTYIPHHHWIIIVKFHAD